MNTWALIYAVGAVQGLLLGLALWRRGPGERLLAGWMLLIAADLAARVWWMEAPSVHSFRAFRLATLFPLLHASLFYLYVRNVLQERALGWRDLRHGLGFGLGLLLIADLLLLETGALLQAMQALRVGAHSGREVAIVLVLFGSSLSYVAAAVVTVLRFRSRLRATRSDGDPHTLRWLLWVAAWQCVIWSVAVAQSLLPVYGLDYRMIYVAVAAWVLAVGYRSLLAPAEVTLRAADAPPPDDLPASASASMDPLPANDATTPLDEPEGEAEDPRFDAVSERLLHLFEHERLYRQPALTIAQVTRRSGYPEYLVSAVINRRFGQPFWDWVNAYRVREAQTRLLDPAEQRSALDIAFEVGFTSKSTFNAAFKRLLGETPSQCRARAQPRVAPPQVAGDTAPPPAG